MLHGLSHWSITHSANSSTSQTVVMLQFFKVISNHMHDFLRAWRKRLAPLPKSPIPPHPPNTHLNHQNMITPVCQASLTVQVKLKVIQLINSSPSNTVCGVSTTYQHDGFVRVLHLQSSKHSGIFHHGQKMIQALWCYFIRLHGMKRQANYQIISGNSTPSCLTM